MKNIACDLQKLINYLLDQTWQRKCEIIPDYMPPHPAKNTIPTVQIKFDDESEYPPFLRYSAGPRQGFFWDIYGDDFQEIELAIIAISKAPTPVNVGPIIFKMKLRGFEDDN